MTEEYEYARRLASNMQAMFYPENLRWEPLPDLMGVLTQIDNMLTGLRRKQDD